MKKRGEREGGERRIVIPNSGTFQLKYPDPSERYSTRFQKDTEVYPTAEERRSKRETYKY